MTKLKAKPPEETKPGKTKAVLYGASGVGKTWFSLSFPTPYYFDTEGGADLLHYQARLKEAGGAYLGPEDGTLDFNFLIEQIQALATEKHPYKTLIIDSITKIYQTAISNEQERLGDKDAFGASKKPAVAAMRRLVSWIMKLDMNVLFIAHETAEWGLDPKGNRTEIGKVPDTWDKLIYELDYSGRVIKTPTGRVMITRKSRLLGFPEGEAFPLEFKEFASRYGKDAIEGESKTITLISNDQLNVITRLLTVVKVDPADLDKYFTKCGVEKMEELTVEQGDKLIDGLKKKVAN